MMRILQTERHFLEERHVEPGHICYNIILIEDQAVPLYGLCSNSNISAINAVIGAAKYAVISVLGIDYLSTAKSESIIKMHVLHVVLLQRISNVQMNKLYKDKN